MKTAVLALALAIPITACTDEEPPVVEQDDFDIINGDPIPASQLPFVGMVRIGTNGLCSGSLLNERVVLTAAHCVPTDGTPLYFTRSATMAGAVWTPVVDMRVQYFWFTNGNVLEKGDIALLRLASPVPSPQYPTLIPDPSALIPCRNNTQCHALTIVGYGENGVDVGYGIKRTGQVAFYSWAQAGSGLRTNTPNDFQEVVPITGLNEQLCRGDSGGPAFVLSSTGAPLLTGVAHAGGTCVPNNGISGVYSSVHIYRDWILAKTRELTGVFGDLNQDGLLTTLDLDAFGIGYRAGAYNPIYDIDNDGDVDHSDGDRMVFDRVNILYGDIDGNGRTDGSDFLLWQRLFGKTTGKWTDGDMNFDGKTDGADLNIWKQNYGANASEIAASTNGLRQ
jgi:hypothetical protein